MTAITLPTFNAPLLNQRIMSDLSWPQRVLLLLLQFHVWFNIHKAQWTNNQSKTNSYKSFIHIQMNAMKPQLFSHISQLRIFCMLRHHEKAVVMKSSKLCSKNRTMTTWCVFSALICINILEVFSFFIFQPINFDLWTANDSEANWEYKNNIQTLT